MKKRKYTQRKRAEQQDQTRQRIVEATMDLHEELGVAHTTVSAVAERAGVQRLTVYRHFPDEEDLLEACTTRWLKEHPLPSSTAWEEETGLERARAALRAFHAYYRSTEAMWAGSYRDRDLVDALGQRMQGIEEHLDAIAEDLARRLKCTGEKGRRARITLRHGLRFPTWQSLRDAGVKSPSRSADLVLSWVEGIC